MRSFSSLLVVTERRKRGFAELGIVRPLFLRVFMHECTIRKGGSISHCHRNIAATNLLDESLKGFIVNFADLPR